MVCAEGAKPEPETMTWEQGGVDVYGHERFIGVATQLSRELEHRLGKEAKPVILGHVQRGGTPTANDRVLATRFGWHAVDAVHKGALGYVTVLHGTQIELLPLAEVTADLKTVPAERFAEAETVI